MNYRDVTLSPDDIEWLKTDIWDAARDPQAFQTFTQEHGLEESVRQFHKAHRSIANKLISRGVTTGKEFPEAMSWIFAARVFKAARQRAKNLHREVYGVEATQALHRKLEARYPRED